MELSALKFAVDTTELDRAGKVIAGLVTDVSKLDKAARDAAKTEEILSKAAKNNAEANLANAKAQDQRLKSTLTADKADQANEKSQTAKTKALESHTKATKENVSILQRQTDIYDFLAQGFSKGQAGILASAKATGQYSKELEQVLELQKQFTSDPFDRSDTGLKRLQRTIKEVTDAQSFFNDGHNLTSKQARELSNDLDRLNAGMKQQGKSYQDITKAQAIYKQQFIEEAAAVNKANASLAVVEKQRKEVASATNYLTQADQKLAAALNVSNNSLDRSSTDSLVKYETALRKSGLAQEVATQKLATYKAQLMQVQAQEQKRAEMNLARAAAPQLTDIGVSLYSGQSPFTVLLQQGGQLADQLKLSGVEADKFGKILKESFYSMVPVIKQVAVGLGGLVTGMFIDAGASVTSFIGKLTGISSAMELAKRAITSGGEENFKYIASLQRIGTVASAVAAAGIGALLAGLVALGVALKQVTDEQNALVKSLNITGAALGLNAESAIKFAQSIEGVKTTAAVDFIQELSNTSAKASTNLAELTKVAVDLEKYGGVALKETAKAYDDLQKKPLEGLIKIAEGTGQVSKETIDLAIQLKLAGDEVGLLKLANEQFIEANKKATESIKQQLNPMSALWITIKDGIGAAWEGLKNFARTGAVLDTVLEAVRGVAKGILAMSTATSLFGKSLAMLVALAGNVGQALQNPFNLDNLKSAYENSKGVIAAYVDDVKNLGKTTTEAWDRINNKTSENKGITDEARAANSAYAADTIKGLNDLEKSWNSIEKAELKKITRQEAINKAVDDFTQKNKQASQWQLDLISKGAGIAWDKANKNSGKQAAKDLDTYADILNKVNGLSSSYNNELSTLQKLRSQNKITEEQYVQAVEDLIKLQPFYIKQQKEINDAHELSNKLLGKTDQLGKDYYTTLEKIQKFQSEGLYSAEEADKLRQAAFDQTELAKQQKKYVEESTKLRVQYREEAQKSLDASTTENQKLDDRVALLGLTNEEQKYLKIQQQQRNSLLAVDLKLTAQIAKIWEDVRQGKLDPFDAMAAQMDAEKAAAEERKNINKEVAIQYREDFQREFIDPIRNGLTDSIVTALFEGGKAGSKKLRDVLVNILRQKVTIVVDAVVNTLLGNVVGGLLGGLGSGAGGGAGGLIGMGLQGASLYNGLTSGSGVLGQIGGFLGLAPSVGVGAGASATAVNGLSALTPVSIGTNSAAVTSVTAGSSSTGVLGSLSAAAPYILAVVALAASWKKLFGRTLKDSGIQGKFGGETGFEGSSYKYYKGGLFRSDKTELTPLEESFRKTLGDAFNAMKVQVTDFAKVLGLNADKLKDFTSEVKISLHGLSEQDAQAKIQEALATVNNEMAQEILGTWKETTREVTSTITGSAGRGADDFEASQRTVTETIRDRVYVESEYAKEGEKAIETLTRLATSLSTVNQVFDTLGYTMYESSLKGGDMASKLADLFGGLDKFVAATTTYYQNFYSEAERQATALRQLDKEFKAHNLTLPKTREEYRRLVEAQDLTTEEGRKLYAWLIQLAPAFADVSQSAADAADAAKNKLRDALESAYSALEKAVQAQIDILKEQETAQTAVVNNLKSIFDLLSKNVKELYQQVDSTSGMLASQGRAVISNALSTGTLPDIATLTDAISAVRSEVEGASYTTQFEADKARLQLAADLQALQDKTADQLSTEELILKAIKDQVKYYENLLVEARNQIDAILGVQTAVLTVTEALDALRKLMFPETAPGGAGTSGGGSGGFVIGGGGSGGGSAGKGSGYFGAGGTEINDAATVAKLDSINAYINTLDFGSANKDSSVAALAAAAMQYGVSANEIAIASGYNLSDIQALLGGYNIPKYADGGAFTNGVVSKPTMFDASQMGENGSEAIMPLTNIGGRLGVSAITSDDSELANRVQNLEIVLQVIAVNTSKVARILDAAQGTDGRSIVTSTV